MRLASALLLLAVAAGSAMAATPKSATMVAVGDVASCRSDGDEATAAIVRTLPGVVALLGDTVYEHGTAEEFAQCFTPSWGRFRARARPALGNHEYGSTAAEPARAYFRLPANGWYAYGLGSWRVVVLNSNCGEIGGCARGSAQWRWLQAELRRHRARCTLAYWHHARWSSGIHGSDKTMADLWDLLASARADVVLAGHDHHYERFAPIEGIRSFVVGTGGRSRYPVFRRLPESRFVRWDVFGVLSLTLRDGAYDWRFITAPGGAIVDRGSGRCR